MTTMTATASPTYDMKELGYRVRTHRENLDISIRALARNSGISHSTLLDIEAGTTMPSLGTIDAIARALKVPLRKLL